MQRIDVSRLQNDKIDYLDQAVLEQQGLQESIKIAMQHEYDINLSPVKKPRNMSPRYLQSDMLKKFSRIICDSPHNDTTDDSQKHNILVEE